MESLKRVKASEKCYQLICQTRNSFISQILEWRIKLNHVEKLREMWAIQTINVKVNDL